MSAAEPTRTHVDNTENCSSPRPIRTFLVVVDETVELKVALRYAARRARQSGGRVALLHVIEPTEFQHWMAVEELIREDRRTEAEQRLMRLGKEVFAATGTFPVFHVREGKCRDELMRLIDEDETISILVLAANIGPEGPGPLVSYLTGTGMSKLRIPLTIVPGSLTDEQIAAIT